MHCWSIQLNKIIVVKQTPQEYFYYDIRLQRKKILGSWRTREAELMNPTTISFVEIEVIKVYCSLQIYSEGV